MRFQLWSDRRCEVEFDLDKPVELGRQKIDEPEPFAVIDQGDHYRCVIAHHTENTLSRDQLRIEASETGIQVFNLNSRRGFELEGIAELEPSGQIEIEANGSIPLPNAEIRFAGNVACQSLPNQTLAPGQLSGLGDHLRSVQLNHDSSSTKAAAQQQLIDWLSKAMLVFQDAATSPRFLRRAADVVRDIVHLATAAVLVRDDQQWNIAAISSDHENDENWTPSRTIIELVAEEKRTFYNLCEETSSVQSLMGVKAIVASPILSGEGDVIGILYGDRRSSEGAQVDQAEAILVEVLATGVAAGLARVAQEEKAIRARADFERSFGHELMQHLEENPQMLAGRVEEVSLMFCDVTGFSTASEKLGPAKTMTWIGQVMKELHECVIENQGVVIDYVGDELIAMWGAPATQSNHAELACQTAITILDRLEKANRNSSFLMPAAVRIGINSGLAHVGDTGTRFRMKYGAMGDAVNLASRIQGATKFFGCEILIAKETREQLDDRFECRRIGKVKVVNIVRPIELFELLSPKSNAAVQSDYEKALRWVESGELDSASGLIQQIAEEFPDDAPTQALRRCIVEIQASEGSGTATEPIFKLPNK